MLDWEARTGHPLGPDGLPDWRAIVHPADLPAVASAWRASIETEATLEVAFRARHADGRWLHLRLHGVPVREADEVVEWIGVVHDLTAQVAAEQALRRAAAEDPLTGLPNRAVFLERLHGLFDRRGGCAAVLYVDLDHFKAINDRFGHASGDAVLVAIAQRLRSAVRPSDLVSRLSGDEFAVICDELHDEAEASHIASRITAAISEPVDFERRVTPSASIGIAHVRARGQQSPESVLHAADAAMYHAKARGGGSVEVFDAELRERLRRRREIESELRSGLQDGGPNLHFQPIISLDRQRSCVETLLRWQRPGRSPISASDAISVAEETGLIAPLGRAVLTTACAQFTSWGQPDINLAVNVSPRQLARPDELIADVRHALTTSGVDPSRLTLEITETVLMEDMDQGETIVKRLRELGVHLEIDDFGVGYSSLSYLHRLPVQALKLDRSFVAGLPHDTASVRILEAVVGLAPAFGVRVIAEGVETIEQLEAVRAAGCHAVQGYALARPVPPGELLTRLDAARMVAAGPLAA